MRRIPPTPSPASIKDANGVYLKVEESLDGRANITPPVTPDPPATDIDLDALQDKVRLILWREIRNLATESSTGLLSKEESQSLVNYARLLSDLKKAEAKALSGLTDEDLET